MFLWQERGPIALLFSRGFREKYVLIVYRGFQSVFFFCKRSHILMCAGMCCTKYLFECSLCICAFCMSSSFSILLQLCSIICGALSDMHVNLYVYTSVYYQWPCYCISLNVLKVKTEAAFHKKQDCSTTAKITISSFRTDT